MIDPGIVAALITPLEPDETINLADLEKLLERTLAAGVTGVFVAGTIGEGLALRDCERARLFRHAVRIVRRRVPVLANVSDTGTRRTLDQMTAAIQAGVDAVVLTPRLSFPQRNSKETLRHVQAVAAASSVPVWFYENPFVAAGSTFEQISEIVALPNVRGLKFSSSDKELFTRCVKELQRHAPVFTGNVGDIAYAVSIGAAGIVAGIANLAPGLCVNIFETARRGDLDKAQELCQTVESIYAIYGSNGWPLWPSAQKHALKRLGVITTSIATAPFLRLGPAEEAVIDEALERIDPALFR